MVIRRWTADGGRTVYYVTAHEWRSLKRRQYASEWLAIGLSGPVERWRLRRV